MSDSDAFPRSLHARLTIDELCTRFEEERSASTQGSLIDDYISASAPELRDDLLAELIAIECEFLDRRNQKPNEANYLKQFAQNPTAVKRGFVLWKSATKPTPRLLDEMPEKIGEYKLLRELGRGGTGVVYEAIQDGLTRHVAIKALLLHHPLSFSKPRTRFEQEAQAAARLDHPNIVSVYDSGEADGILYYAMQLVDGKTLRTVIEEADANTTSPKFAADIIIQAAHGLAYAHSNSVLHRDIKPSNLLIDKNNHVYVVDFGLAKIKDLDSDLTTSGDVVGTLRYLAPEAFDGLRDERADVYGLGLTLYELLTLQPVFRETNRTHLIKQIGRGTVSFPVDAAARIPRDLQTITLKAIARDPADRYSSARELADDLSRFRSGRLIRARQATVFERGWRWAQRNQATAAFAAATLLLVLLGLPTVAWFRAEATTARTAAALERSEREKANSLATAESAKFAAVRNAKRNADYAFLVRDIESAVQLGRYDMARNLMSRAETSPPETSLLLDAKQRDRRDWEWDFLAQQLDSSILAFQAHNTKVQFMAVSPDDSTLATIGESIMDPDSGQVLYGDVAIWDLASGKRLRTLTGEEAFTGCDFSPDGSHIATISIHNPSSLNLKGFIRIWELRSGKLIQTIELTDEHLIKYLEQEFGFLRQFVPNIRYDESGNYLVTSSPVTAYRTGTWERVWQTPGVLATIQPRTNSVLSLSGEHLRLHDIETGKHIATDKRRGAWLHHGFDFSNDGQKFLTYTRAGNQIFTTNIVKNEIRRTKPKSIKQSACILLAPDGKTFIRCDTNGDLQRLDMETPAGPPIQQFVGHRVDVHETLFSHDGTKLIAGAVNGSIRVWELDKLESHHVRKFDTKYDSRDAVQAISFDRMGTKVYYANSSYRRTSRQGRGASGWFRLDGSDERHHEIQTTHYANWPRADITYSPRGNFLAASAREQERPPAGQEHGYAKSGKVHLFSSETGQTLDTVDLGHRYITAICWSSDQAIVAVATISNDKADQSASIASFTVNENGKAGDVQWIKVKDTPESLSICFVPKSEQLLCHTSTAILRLDLGKRTTEELWERSRVENYSMAVNRTGTRLAVASFLERVVRLYDLNTRAKLMDLEAPRAVCSVQFSPNGRRLAMVGYDNIVHFCDAESGYRLLTLNGQSEYHNATRGFSPQVIFSNDGRFVATNALNKRITVWEAEPDSSQLDLTTTSAE